MKPVRKILFFSAIVGICYSLPGDCRVATAQSGTPPGPSFIEGRGDESEIDRPPSTSKPAPAKKKTASGSTTKPPGGGQSTPLPNTPTPREILEIRRLLKGPRYAVNSMELAGVANKSQAELTATLTVQVLDDKGWVIVPLGLNEAVLRVGTKYEFLGRVPGQAPKGNAVGEQNFKELNATQGYLWWLKGKGYHKLTLSLLVPLSKQNSHHRLKLTSPPRTAASTLKIQVAIPNKQLSVSRAKGIRPTSKGTGRSSDITVTGLGDQLDLQWRELPPQRKAEKVLRAETYMLVKLSATAAVITAEQRIRTANDGSFSTIEVQLPAGFVIKDVNGPNYRNHTPLDANNRTVVELDEPQTESTKLLWTLRRKSKLLGGRLNIEGFNVDRARFQSGEIAIEKVQGLRIVHREQESRKIGQMPISDFGAPGLVGKAPLARAFEIEQQPFRLSLSVSRVKSHVTVTPRLTLRIDENEMELDGKFHVTVRKDQGTVEEMVIEWPDRVAEQWEILPINAPDLVESFEVGGKNNRGTIRVRFTREQSGEFELPIRASRKIATNGKEFTFSLPSLSVQKMEKTTLKVVHNANQKIELATIDEDAVLDELDKGDRNSLERSFEIEQQPASKLSLAVSTHKQKITTNTSIQATAKAARLQVFQTIHYLVEYEKLTEVRFSLPTKLAKEIVRFLGPDDKPMQPDGDGLVDGENTEFTFTLPEPALDRIQFEIQFNIAIEDIEKAETKITASIPIVESSDSAYSEVRFEIQESEHFSPRIADENWQLANLRDQKPTWIAKSGTNQLALTLTPTKIPPSSGYTIRRAFVQSAIDLSGRMRSRARYRIESKPSRIVMFFPSALTAEAFWWGGKKIEPRISENTDGDVTVYRLDLPAKTSSEPQWLKVDFHNQQNDAFRWFASHELPAPSFPPNVWIEQTRWRVTLPSQHHLFSNPAGYASRFQWGRGMLFWQRQPAESNAADIQRFMREDRQDFAQGNSYEFSCYGPAQTMSLDSMNRSLIVLFGAGFAWIVGILMVKLSFMRSVVALLTAALAMAIAGVWYLVQVQVLLQPAILGMLLAGLFVWIERRMKRPSDDTAVLTISQPSDFLKPEAQPVSSNVKAPPFAGSEDVTAVRPAMVRYQESGSASDVKSHS